MKQPICFRLRKNVDEDLIEATAQMSKEKVAELCRNGMRLMLGIRTTKRTQVIEIPIEPTVEIRSIGTKSQFNGQTSKPFVQGQTGLRQPKTTS